MTSTPTAPVIRETAALPAAPLGRDLSSLFDPCSVAVIGASDDPAKWGGAIARQALRGADRRPVHLINRRGGTILGRPAATSAGALGEPLGLAVLCVPAAAFDEALDDALAAGAKAVVAITAGFGETGPEGLARQQAAAERVRAAGAVLVGPNCLGLVDNSTGVYLASDPFDQGGVALLSQSGNLALELGLRLRRRGAGFSRFVSLGNQADVTLADLVADCGRHAQTTAIAVYAEDFADGRAFAETAAHVVAETGKPVVLLTAGRGEASARGARSHTGAMTTPSDVIAAVCRDAGIHRVGTPRELATVLTALGGPRRAAGREVAVLTDGGGHGALAADAVEGAGLHVPELTEAAQARVRTHLWPQSATANPVDLAGMGEQDPLSYAHSAVALLGEPEVDAVLLTGYFGGYSAASEGTGGLGDGELGIGEQKAAEAIVAAHAAGGKPLVVQSMYPDSPTGRILAEGAIPVFGAVEDAARALAALAQPSDVAGIEPAPPAEPPLTDLGYFAVRGLLAGHGIEFPSAAEAVTGEEVLTATDTIPGPYVLKAVHLLHKSDAGGVALGLKDPHALAAAWQGMHEKFADADDATPRYSVEAMADVSDAVELIVGVRRDPRFGPVVMVGLGGITAETLKDTAFALAPLTPAAAERLLRSLRCAPLLDGVRGRPGVDVAAAARVVSQLARAAAAHPEISELEVNPLSVSPRGALALDARALAV